MNKTPMRTLVLGTCLVILTALPAPAQELSLRQALVLGLTSNYDLRIASLEVERAAAGVTGEEGRFDLTAELAVNRSRTEIPAASPLITGARLTTNQTQAEAALFRQFAAGLQTRLSLNSTRTDADSLAQDLEPAYRTMLILDITQPLLRNRGADINTADLRIATTRRQQAALGFLDAAQQLAYQIELAYLDLAQAEADLRTAIAARDLAEDLLNGNQRKLEAGLIPATEISEAQTAVMAREQTILLHRQRIAQTRNLFLDRVDQNGAALPADWQVSLPAKIEQDNPDLHNALNIARQERPDLRQARLELEISKQTMIFADNQQLPNLDLEARFGLNGLAGETDQNSTYSGSWQHSLDADGSSWYAGLRLQMPLQNRFAKGQYRAALAQDQQAFYQVRRIERSAETQIRAAHATLELGLDRLAVARRSTELAQITLDQENRRLAEGLSDTFRILIFQNALVNAQATQVAALADYHRARAALFKAMGTNLSRYDIVAALPPQGALP